MCKTWPFMDDLLKGIRMPDTLAARLRQRYDEHAMEYATDEVVKVGDDLIPRNACLNKNTLQDIEEEVVDALFNVLVLIFKDEQPTGRPSGAPLRPFVGNLVHVWQQTRLLEGKLPHVWGGPHDKDV